MPTVSPVLARGLVRNMLARLDDELDGSFGPSLLSFANIAYTHEQGRMVPRSLFNITARKVFESCRASPACLASHLQINTSKSTGRLFVAMVMPQENHFSFPADKEIDSDAIRHEDLRNTLTVTCVAAEWFGRTIRFSHWMSPVLISDHVLRRYVERSGDTNFDIPTGCRIVSDITRSAIALLWAQAAKLIAFPASAMVPTLGGFAIGVSGFSVSPRARIFQTDPKKIERRYFDANVTPHFTFTVRTYLSADDLSDRKRQIADAMSPAFSNLLKHGPSSPLSFGCPWPLLVPEEDRTVLRSFVDDIAHDVSAVPNARDVLGNGSFTGPELTDDEFALISTDTRRRFGEPALTTQAFPDMTREFNRSVGNIFGFDPSHMPSMF